MGNPTDQTPGSIGVRNVSGGGQAGGVFFSPDATPDVPTHDFIQWIQSVKGMTLFAYDGNNRLEYIGIGLPGADTSDAAWQIQKMIYDGPGKNANVVQILLPKLPGAGPTDPPFGGFRHVWNDRATLDFPDPTVP